MRKINHAIDDRTTPISEYTQQLIPYTAHEDKTQIHKLHILQEAGLYPRIYTAQAVDKDFSFRKRNLCFTPGKHCGLTCRFCKSSCKTELNPTIYAKPALKDGSLMEEAHNP